MVLDKVPGGYRSHFPLEGLQLVDAVGCSGMAISREVLLKVGAPWFRFEYGQDGLMTKGEDFQFCDRVKEAGFELAVWCESYLNHYVETRL